MVDCGGTLLLRAIVVVTSLLLLIAGDVETNPGPEGTNKHFSFATFFMRAKVPLKRHKVLSVCMVRVVARML